MLNVLTHRGVTPAGAIGRTSPLFGVGLGPEQKSILEATRRFAKEVVAPVAADLDRSIYPEDCFSWDIVEKADAAGIRTATLAAEFGGAGVDSLTTAMMIEELAKADLGVSVIFAQTLKIAQTLQGAATAEQKARFLGDYAADPRGLLAIAITEPDRASDYIIPYPTGDYQTKAVRSDG
ncbi:MAG TPA: acyl-CoA dehydrogenase family protein, partial [Acidimicrobiia bacterium]|nr:acyl-CoA dehydrogenase family protein [Acidimicrobiia bacterium]